MAVLAEDPDPITKLQFRGFHTLMWPLLGATNTHTRKALMHIVHTHTHAGKALMHVVYTHTYKANHSCI